MCCLVYSNAYFILLERNKKNSMEKKNVLTLLVLYLRGIYSQVGINTSSPKITLDVVGDTSKPVIPDGSIAPEITAAQLNPQKYILPYPL